MIVPPCRDRDENIVRLNDLWVARGHEGWLNISGLNCLDALMTADILSHVPGDRLDKPGLERWRERFRLNLTPPTVTAGTDHHPLATLFLKRFRHPPARARSEVRRAGSGAASVAGVEWTWMRRLRADGIACVEPVAFGEEFRRGRETRSAILMAPVPGVSLENWFEQRTWRDRCELRPMIGPLADFIGRFHQAGYVHRDLYLSHLFYEPETDGSPHTRFHLIDLQRVRRPTIGLRRWIIKDLAALNYSAPRDVVTQMDRMRWLMRYLGITRLDGPARRLWYRVAGKTEWIRRHDRRRREHATVEMLKPL